MPTLEIIPINHLYPESSMFVPVHLGHLNHRQLRHEPIDEILLLNLTDKSHPETGFLTGTLEMIHSGPIKTQTVSLEYPQIIQDLKKIRENLEKDKINYEIFINLTPFTRILHAVLFRDAFDSDKYDYYPFEIWDIDQESFSFIMIPNTRKLGLFDWQILNHMIDKNNIPQSIASFLKSPVFKEKGKTLQTPDQKFRNHLNNLVDKGLLEFNTVERGKKKYYIKLFELLSLKITPKKPVPDFGMIDLNFS